jgi:hypothetical protein
MFNKITSLAIALISFDSCSATRLVSRPIEWARESLLMSKNVMYKDIRENGLSIIYNLQNKTPEQNRAFLQEKEQDIVNFLAAVEYEGRYGLQDGVAQHNAFLLRCHLKNAQTFESIIQRVNTLVAEYEQCYGKLYFTPPVHTDQILVEDDTW